ncbi:MAG: hypothetical protein WCA84_16305 [Ignavibacteriaceae bacterium]
MALIKCKECQKEISNEAVSCPHCGVQVNKSPGMKLITKLSWIGLVGMVIWWIIQIVSVSNMDK